jgi:hypothetical protein
MIRYNYETLIAYCIEKELVIKPIENNKFTRETVIEGQCKMPNCKESFSKTFRQMVKVGGFCGDCSKTIGMVKNETTYLEKHTKSLTDYCLKNEIQLLKSYEGEHIDRDTVIEGNCKTPECGESFSKPLRQLLKLGGFCLECAKDLGKVKIENTNLERFGCKSSMQNKDVREKARKTIIEKYGVEYASQSEIVKQRTKETCMERFGVEYALQSPAIRQQIVETNLVRYGVENAQQNKVVKAKTMETVLEKYGVNCVLNYEEFKEKSRQTNLRKYGVEHHLQNAEYAEKHMKATFKIKKYTLPSGKVINYQGYENFGLDELLFNEKIDEDDITTNRTEVPEIWYFDKNGKRCRHFVDLFIKSQNRCVEIKSTWTNQEKNSVYEKQAAAIEQGYLYDVWIYTRDGKRVNQLLEKKVEQN